MKFARDSTSTFLRRMRVRDIGVFKNALNAFWQALFSLDKLLCKDICFVSLYTDYGPYISRNFFIRTHFVSASEKNRTFARKFAAQGVEINGVKVHFNVKYFCKKKLRYENW